jgi:hypothetical protein
VIEIVRSFVNNALEAGKDLFRAVRDGIAELAGKVKDKAKAAVEAALEAVKALGDAFYNAGKAVMAAFANGIKDAAGSVLDAAGNVLGSIKDKLPGSEPRDPTSPLRRLDKPGAALVENFAAGIARAAPLAARELSRLTSGLALELSASAALSPVAAPVVNVPAAIAGSLAERPELVQNFSVNTSGYGPQSDATEALSHLATLLRGRGFTGF